MNLFMFAQGYYYWNELNGSQWLDRQSTREIQNRKLAKLLLHAYSTNAYYKGLLDSSGIEPGRINLNNMHEIPVTHKKDLQGLPPGRILSSGYSPDSCIRKHTSGSTGEPFDVYYSKSDYSVLAAVTLRNFTNTGAGLFEKRIELEHPGLIDDPQPLLNRLGILKSRKMSTHEELHKIIGSINKYRPKSIAGYPTILKMICAYALENNIALHSPGAVFCRSEYLDASARQLIEEAFKSPVFDFYGCWEMGLFAFECEEHNGFHISQETCIAEFLDKDNNRVKPGEAGAMVCTNLHSYAMPFIRYSIGDVAEYTEEPCPCGRISPRIRKFHGRKNDYLVMPSGKIIPPSDIIVMLAAVEGIKQFQLIQEAPDKILVKVHVRKGCDETRVKDTLTAVLLKVLGDVKVHVVFVENLSAEDNLKLRTIIPYAD